MSTLSLFCFCFFVFLFFVVVVVVVVDVFVCFFGGLVVGKDQLPVYFAYVHVKSCFSNSCWLSAVPPQMKVFRNLLPLWIELCFLLYKYYRLKVMVLWSSYRIFPRSLACSWAVFTAMYSKSLCGLYRPYVLLLRRTFYFCCHWGCYDLCPRLKPTRLAQLLFILILCLFLSARPSQLYFIL